MTPRRCRARGGACQAQGRRTQDFLADLLAIQRGDPISTHLEVETYTWDVLPTELRDAPITSAIAAELRWVLERLS